MCLLIETQYFFDYSIDTYGKTLVQRKCLRHLFKDRCMDYSTKIIPKANLKEWQQKLSIRKEFLLFVESLTFQQNNWTFKISWSSYKAGYVSRHQFYHSILSSLSKKPPRIKNITIRQIYVSCICVYNNNRHCVSPGVHLCFRWQLMSWSYEVPLLEKKKLYLFCRHSFCFLTLHRKFMEINHHN